MWLLRRVQMYSRVQLNAVLSAVPLTSTRCEPSKNRVVQCPCNASSMNCRRRRRRRRRHHHHHHHHHHRFNVFYDQMFVLARVKTVPKNAAPPSRTILCIPLVQSQPFHVFLHTLLPSLPASTSAPYPFHYQASTC